MLLCVAVIGIDWLTRDSDFLEGLPTGTTDNIFFPSHTLGINYIHKDHNLLPTQNVVYFCAVLCSLSYNVLYCVCICMGRCVCFHLQSCCYFNHNFCPLSCSSFVGPCRALCVLCNTWRPQPECKCAYARYSIDHRSLVACGSSSKKTTETTEYIIYNSLPFLNSFIQLTSSYHTTLQ